MLIKRSFVIAVVALSFTASTVLAQEASPSAPVQSDPVMTQLSPQPLRLVTNAPVQTRQNLLIEKEATLRENVQQKRMDALSTGQARREQFKEKLSVIRDAQKLAVVQRLDNNFVAINNASTDRWISALEQLSSMVDRASSEAADLEASGVNTAVLDQAIVRAQTAITTAQTAVINQAGKSYIMTITTEAALRTNVGSTVTQFRNDLRNTYSIVANAKQSVVQVVRALATDKDTPAPLPEATESAVDTE